MLLNRPHPGPGIQAESFRGFRTESAIVPPSSGNFPVRNTYISALSYSTATSFRLKSVISWWIATPLSGLTPFLSYLSPGEKNSSEESGNKFLSMTEKPLQIVFTVTQQKNKL